MFARDAGPVLAEGSVYERLRRDPGTPFDPHVGTGALVLADGHRQRLADVHREYLRIGVNAGLPMLLQTDTWRCTEARTKASSWRGTNLNLANAELVIDIAGEGRSAGGTVLVGGLLGPAGDAYDPDAALESVEARSYHEPQAEALAQAGVDLLLCATVPALTEALGLAEAMGATGLPYLVGFVVRQDGRLLDGTPLRDAVETIDSVVAAPEAYFLNCVHPRVADCALRASGRAASRIVGLLANTSTRDPADLDGLAELETAEPGPFAADIAAVAAERQLRLLGGCCGTDQRHIAELARVLTGDASPSLGTGEIGNEGAGAG